MGNIYDKLSGVLLILSSISIMVLISLIMIMGSISSVGGSVFSTQVIALSVLGIILSIFLLFAGIQLFRGKKWAKITGIVFYSLIIIMGIISSILNPSLRSLNLIIPIIAIILIAISMKKGN
jgi:hypothetical protein